MRIVCWQTILMKYHVLFVIMKYHVLFVIFEKQQHLKLSSAANYRWCLIVNVKRVKRIKKVHLPEYREDLLVVHWLR